MRIGIDARFLTHPQPGGFKTYTVNLLTALAQSDRDNEFFIYVDRLPSEGVTLPASPNFTYRIVTGTAPVAGMPFREQFGLRRQIAHDRPDLVHFLCNTATVGLSERYVVTLHDTMQLTTKNTRPGNLADLKRWAIAFYSKQSILRAVHGADQIITVSEYVRGEINRTLGTPLERITVVYQALNPVFAPADSRQREIWLRDIEQRLGIRGRFVLGVGYEARKNIPLLIRAFAQIASGFSDLSLVIVAAEEHQRAAFEALANGLGLTRRTVVLGAISLSDLVRLYNLAEMFVFPSEREGYGLPPLEAMACGVPTLVMNRSSLPEVVQDGALLVDGDDVSAWAHAMQQVISDEAQRIALRERGLRRAAMLSWRRCAEETLNVYRSAVRRAREPVQVLPSLRSAIGAQKDDWRKS